MAELALDVTSSTYFPHGYQVSQEAWERLDFPRLEDFAPREPMARRVQVARAIAAELNAEKDFTLRATRPARTGELLTLGLLTDVLRYLWNQYCTEYQPGVMPAALEWLATHREEHGVQSLLSLFLELFPPEVVRREELDAKTYYERGMDELPSREACSREMALLALFHENLAAAPYWPLHEDDALDERGRYQEAVRALEAFFETQPPHPVTGEALLAMLRAPMKASPDSLEGQLDFVRRQWRRLLPQTLLDRLVLAQDILREETQIRGMGGPGPQEVLDFKRTPTGYPEFEAFSVDKDWMPNVVLIAKTIFVWLDQLSRKHGRAITRLDQIPDAELEQLAHWGVNGLWLIGVWERSRASQTIKEMMGNPEAAASAYSLYDYVIAHELGGEEAYRELAGRAWHYGIRLASDMVPNHVGIYSRWVVEHPDWFIQLDHPPFPGYSFSGQNLSSEERVGIYLEDGYWNHSDAAVVFKRVDHWSGNTRYIYHGNDGTSMPWNDTAQLNYLIPELREAVIQTILHVARRFPIIRFDAAMTLAKKHYQRLWFPVPGEGGGIPSRAEHGMTREDFDRVFPLEFWREVVDRVAAEAPDTLLLAEAFWLMEGYFVRTLGMHRVYNSAFMNMLKMEENANYRQTIKNVLEFSPAVLQRFVNFMNNPDEDTAVAQFGKGDKYFGVAMLMVTMPGLPMLGHGQIEGLTEKYGMEFRRARWEEQADEDLIRRHEHEIFPLMRRRYLFSGAENFALFDLYTGEGWVDENVLAYSNRVEDERAFVVYNNAYHSTQGTLHHSTAINCGSADAPALRRRTLAEALALDLSPTCYYIFRDHRNGLEYLRHAQQLAEQGLRLELHGYQYYVFLDWRNVDDTDLSWGRLDALLGGAGVPSVAEAYQEMTLAEIIEPFQQLLRQRLLREPNIAALQDKKLEAAYAAFAKAVGTKLQAQPDVAALWRETRADLEKVMDWRNTLQPLRSEPALAKCFKRSEAASATPAPGRQLVLWALLRRLGALASTEAAEFEETTAQWLREWYLLKQMTAALRDAGEESWQAEHQARLVRLCMAHGRSLLRLEDDIWGPLLDTVFGDHDVERFLILNHHNGHRWINREQLEALLDAVFLTRALAADLSVQDEIDRLLLFHENLTAIREAAEDTGYDLDWMLSALK